MSDLDTNLCSTGLFQVAAETDLEKELSKMKTTKAIINSNPPEEIKQSYVESVGPTLTQLRGLFDDCTFAKKKVKIYSPINNECMHREMK